MSKLILSILMLSFGILIMFTGFVNAEYKTQKINTDYDLIFSADNATNCTFGYIQYADNDISNYMGLLMTKNNQLFNLTIRAGNFTKLGDTCMFYTCYDPSATPNTASGNTCVTVKTTLENVTLTQTLTYILFLLLCLSLILISVRITIKNPYKEDVNESQKYNIRKESRFKYYLILLKEKFWIVGIFGIWIFLLLFIAILNTLVYNLGLLELNTLLISLNQVLLWLTIPFILFWFCYILIYFFNATTQTMKQQFGAMRG